MNHYLVVFDRSTGKVLQREQFSDRNEALAARFAVERERRGEADVEVVVLGAQSWEALKRTHGRYFKNFDQLASV
jgi:hypothetical protein